MALVSSAELVMGVCHDGKVSSYHAFCGVQCSERCLCIVQASRFLSPSVTIKLLCFYCHLYVFIVISNTSGCLALKTRKCDINLNKMVNVRMSLNVGHSRFNTCNGDAIVFLCIVPG
jgi:hypothetical protein